MPSSPGKAAGAAGRQPATNSWGSPGADGPSDTGAGCCPSGLASVRSSTWVPRSRGSHMQSRQAAACRARDAPTRPAPCSAAGMAPRAVGRKAAQTAVVWRSCSGRLIGPDPTFSWVRNRTFL
jgi:hypothetical protein